MKAQKLTRYELLYDHSLTNPLSGISANQNISERWYPMAGNVKGQAVRFAG